MLGITELILSYFSVLNYWTVFLLMTLESSFVPFPSEVIVPPAAYLAQKGDLNIFLVIIAGIAGSLVGAIINYLLALYLGRVVVYKLVESKIFKLALINAKKVEKSENFFLKYGGISTFTGRLIPVIRQLISLPAGFSKMNFKKFCLYTSLGSGVWVVILAVLGYYFGANKELLSMYFKEISIVFVVLAIALFVLAIFIKKRRKNNNNLSNINSVQSPGEGNT